MYARLCCNDSSLHVPLCEEHSVVPGSCYSCAVECTESFYQSRSLEIGENIISYHQWLYDEIMQLIMLFNQSKIVHNAPLNVTNTNTCRRINVNMNNFAWSGVTLYMYISKPQSEWIKRKDQSSLWTLYPIGLSSGSACTHSPQHSVQSRDPIFLLARGRRWEHAHILSEIHCGTCTGQSACKQHTTNATLDHTDTFHYHRSYCVSLLNVVKVPYLWDGVGSSKIELLWNISWEIMTQSHIRVSSPSVHGGMNSVWKRYIKHKWRIECRKGTKKKYKELDNHRQLLWID